MLRRLIVLVSSLLAVAAPTLAAEAEFVMWARARLAPLDASSQAFRALDSEIRRARLVGMGESVHESEPFLSFRVRFVKDLILRHQVTALAFESGLAEAMALDAYVQGRAASVDYPEALPGGFAHLSGIRDFIEWLRAWNQGEGRPRPVRVYGADVPGREASMLPGLDRLEELTAGNMEVKARIDAIRPLASKIAAPWWRPAQEKYEALPVDEKAALAADVTRLVEAVNRLTAVDSDRLEWTRRVALVIAQSEAMSRLGQFSPTVPRDLAMADNLMWILGRIGPGERAVYWAHNAHVQKTPVTGPPLPPGRYPGTGLRLNERLGRGYVAVGTAYGGPSRNGGADLAEGSVDAALALVSATAFLLPLGGKRPPEKVASWLSEERPMRFQVEHLLVPLGTAFDAVAYFDHAEPAPTASAPREPAGRSSPRLSARVRARLVE